MHAPNALFQPLPFATLGRLGAPLVAAVVVLSVAPWAGSGWLQDRVRTAVRHPARTAVP